MLLIGLIALWILSIVGFFVYAIKKHKDGTERMSIESQFIAGYGAVFILLTLVLLLAGTNSSSEMSPAEEEIAIADALVFLGMASWAAIFLIEVIAWAIRKLICTMISRKHAICEVPSLISNLNILTDYSIRGALALCKESAQCGVSDDFVEALESRVVNGVLTFNLFAFTDEKCDMFILSDPEDLEANDG